MPSWGRPRGAVLTPSSTTLLLSSAAVLSLSHSLLPSETVISPLESPGILSSASSLLPIPLHPWPPRPTPSASQPFRLLPG